MANQNHQRIPIACPNRLCRRRLTWVQDRKGWRAPKHDGCAICKTPEAYGRALAANQQGKSWKQLREEN